MRHERLQQILSECFEIRRNPPNGSWGMVKIQPTTNRRICESPQRQLGDG